MQSLEGEREDGEMVMERRGANGWTGGWTQWRSLWMSRDSEAGLRVWEEEYEEEARAEAEAGAAWRTAWALVPWKANAETPQMRASGQGLLLE